ncbi:MAG: flagellar hook capping protein [Sphingobium sp.]|jgi:flagellar basal-body rod modification protein FlgD|nr:MAG: flagellar hook capping protein [Sphingobium sp.]
MSSTIDTAGLTTYDSSTVQTTGVGKSEMGQSDFLRLLTTQLQTQDPFEPMDNTQMVTQMATITNSTGIAEMNQTLSSIKEQMSGSRINDAASWIGKSMLVESNIVAPNASGQYSGAIALGAAADNVSVQLVDGSGNVVRTIDMGALEAGSYGFSWDGKDEAGNVVSTDSLQVKVTGATPTGIATWATIAAVQSPADGSSAKLITALGAYSPSDAIQLS